MVESKKVPQHWEWRVPDDAWPLTNRILNPTHICPPGLFTPNVDLSRSNKNEARISEITIMTYQFIKLLGEYLPTTAAKTLQQLRHGW